MRARPGDSPRFRLSFLLLLIAVAFAGAGCAPDVDLKSGLQVTVVRTGWFDAGITGDGKNKLVPTVSFRVMNVSNRKLAVLQVNALFHRVNEPDEWGSGLVSVAGSEGLAPGATSPVLTVKSQLGYTGTDSRADMLKNSQFVDAKVNLFAKYGSVQWTPIGEYPIARQLITQ
jgi:hypothetical protein